MSKIKKLDNADKALIQNNANSIIVGILNRLDFGETDDLEKFIKAYCGKYVEVYKFIDKNFKPDIPEPLTLNIHKSI
jgi:hypothetical protein